MKRNNQHGFSFTGLINGINATINLGHSIRAMMPTPAPVYQEPKTENTDPMEGMASGKELSKYSYRPGAFYLGNIAPEHKIEQQAGIYDDRHIFLVAGNAAGKGRSILIQNALRWKGGAVFLDPKGEIASITAMRRGTSENAKGTGTSVRQFLGQKIIILDPFDQVEGAARIY